MTLEIAVDPLILQEMRARYREGCSVVELLRHVRGRFPDREVGRRELIGYFREAFQLKPNGMYVLGCTESFGNGESPDSKLNWLFIPQILASRAEWDPPRESEDAWYAQFESTAIGELHRFAEQNHCQLSPQSWAALSPADREILLALEASRLKLSEDVQSLAALVECLQRRIREMESQPMPIETPSA